MVRQFCHYVPTSPEAIEFHYLGVIEEVAALGTRSYMFFMIDCESLKVSRFAENINISAIKSTESGFVVTEDRVSNSETAKCNADYEYLYHDIKLDLDGNIIRNDSTHEYDLEELKRRYDSKSGHKL